MHKMSFRMGLRPASARNLQRSPRSFIAGFYETYTSKGMCERTGGTGTEWKGKGGGRGMITRIRDVRTCQPW